jgi:hypothetical protein
MSRKRVIGVVLACAIAVFMLTGASSCDTSMSDSSSGGSDATEVTFTVTGDAPSGVDITYGNDSSNYQGPKQPALYETLPIDKDAMYYQVSAQLMGGGNVTCEISIGDEVRTGHAVGGYNICSAQLNADFDGGWG